MTAEQNLETPLSDLTFRQGMAELDAIVNSLENNTMELEQSLEAYERGVALVRELRGRLDTAEQRVEVLMGELAERVSDEEMDSTLQKA